MESRKLGCYFLNVLTHRSEYLFNYINIKDHVNSSLPYFWPTLLSPRSLFYFSLYSSFTAISHSSQIWNSIGAEFLVNYFLLLLIFLTFTALTTGISTRRQRLHQRRIARESISLLQLGHML